jgi:hypothetical protein
MKRRYSRKKGASVIKGQVKEHLLAALKVGCPVTVATQIVKIDQTTFHRALKRSPQLRQEVESAQGELIQGLSSMILLAAKNGQWTAGAWMLERRWPEFFGRVERQEVSGPGGMPLAIASASQEEYVRAVRRALGFNEPEEGTKPPCPHAVIVEAAPLPQLPPGEGSEETPRGPHEAAAERSGVPSPDAGNRGQEATP